MKKIIIYGASIFTMMFAMASCGGAEEESTDETSEDSTATEQAEVVEYDVDTAASIINWYSMEEGEKAHHGSVKVLNGSYSVQGDEITSASLTINMNSFVVEDEAGGEKLQSHLSSPDFFDLNQYGTSSFTFIDHSDGMITGKLNVVGLEMDVEAPVTLSEGKVEVGDFTVNMVQLPFYANEREEKPEADWHDPKIGFNATIVAQ
ncbi:MAG: YceI family protein [Crocinitomicaceae bacterium]|nr:YceI family protein [Crocinitomicaceae bacterium]